MKHLCSFLLVSLLTWYRTKILFLKSDKLAFIFSSHLCQWTFLIFTFAIANEMIFCFAYSTTACITGGCKGRCFILNHLIFCNLFLKYFYFIFRWIVLQNFFCAALSGCKGKTSFDCYLIFLCLFLMLFLFIFQIKCK